MTDRIIDFIGDVHGCGQTLGRLLRKLGYQFERGAYRHSERRVVFIGDLFDRGPRVRLATQIARAMVDADQATWVLGNHELDVMSLVLMEDGRPLRPATQHALKLTRATFEDFDPPELLSLCEWLKDCPLFVDQPEWRAVHACWDQQAIDRVRARFNGASPGNSFAQIYQDETLKKSVARLVRGPSLPLPQGRYIQSADGVSRKRFRVAFWIDDPNTLGDLVFQPDPLPEDLNEHPVDHDQQATLPYYAPNLPPVFFGHYWRRGAPELVASNLVCLDYCAVLREKLVCYSHLPGETLDACHFSWIESMSEWR